MEWQMAQGNFQEFSNFREKGQPPEVEQNFRNELFENLRSI